MKWVLLILSYLLSWSVNDCSDRQHEYRLSFDHTLSSTDSQGRAQDSNDYRNCFLFSTRGESVTGESHSSVPTVRSLGSSRRTLSSTRFSSKLIKDGKVVDTLHVFSFLRTIFGHPTGKFSHGRLIYSIHYLLI